jgi:arsenate reductase
MTVVVWHNPNCATSRKVVAIIRASGIEPNIAEYLKTPPSKKEIKAALAAMGITARALLRRRGTPYDQLGLDDPKRTDAELIDAMHEHPILIKRPVVRSRRGTRLCRPAERVSDLL